MMLESTPKMSWEQLLQFMKDNPVNLLTLAAPLMLLCVFLEIWYSHKKNLQLYSRSGLISSIGVGIGYLIITGLSSSLTFYAVWWVYYHGAPFALPTSWWSFILCAVVYDFFRYWAHRITHEQRFWWASHITHHSAEQYNLTVSFRLCWVDQIKLIFFLPVALLGFDPVQFFLVHQIGVLYQFWQHTSLIPVLPRWIEAVMVTPTNHRVHHGKNETYIDVNYGSMFIIWDKMFGTYREPAESPEYGVKQPINSANPVYLVFHEYIDWMRDVWHAPNWKSRWKATFGRPGEYDGVEKF